MEAVVPILAADLVALVVVERVHRRVPVSFMEGTEVAGEMQALVQSAGTEVLVATRPVAASTLREAT